MKELDTLLAELSDLPDLDITNPDLEIDLSELDQGLSDKASIDPTQPS